MKNFLREIIPLRASTFAAFRTEFSKFRAKLLDHCSKSVSIQEQTEKRLGELFEQQAALLKLESEISQQIEMLNKQNEEILAKLDALESQCESTTNVVDEMRISYNCDNALLVQSVEQLREAMGR